MKRHYYLLKKEKLINSYYVEIATDNAFINRIIKSAINATNITFTTKYLGQMFLRVRAQDNINGLYAGFGEVIEGLDVVDKIASVKTDYSDRPIEEQKIKSITVDTMGETYEEPEKY